MYNYRASGSLDFHSDVVAQEELSSLKDGEVRERTPARPPARNFGPVRLGQALFGQRASPSVPPRTYGKSSPGAPQLGQQVRLHQRQYCLIEKCNLSWHNCIIANVSSNVFAQMRMHKLTGCTQFYAAIRLFFVG